MGWRIQQRPTAWGRRLHLERLELRAAPGALLASAGFFGPTLFDLAAVSTPHVEDNAATTVRGTDESRAESITDEAPAPAVDWSALLSDLPLDRNAPIAAAPVGVSGRRSFGSIPFASALHTDWNALAHAALPVDHAAPTEPPILKTSTLANPVTSGGGSSAGGGGASKGGGGAAGSTRSSLADGATGSTPALPTATPLSPPAAPAAPSTGTAPTPQSGALAEPVAPEGSASEGGAWSAPNGIGQCSPPAGNPAATFDNSTAAGLQFVDAAGQSLNITLDGNTLVIGAATWCGNTAKLKAQLATPEAQQALAGLKVVWAFGDEGGSGPGGVLHSEFLEGLPGETAFLAESSVHPWRFPSAFNAASGQFDLHPLDVIEPWYASRRDATTWGSLSETGNASGLALVDAAGQPLNFTLDNNTIVIAAATWCPHCAELEADLNNPDAQDALTGLRIIFAFGNEGGTGPGGVANPEFLNSVPGEVAFLAADSVQPPSFPSAYNPATGQFDLDGRDAIGNWYANVVGTLRVPQQQQLGVSTPDPLGSDSSYFGDGTRSVPATLGDIGGGQSVCTLTGDYNHNGAVDAGDYVMWRKTLDQTGAGLSADGNGDLVVDQLDYGIWRGHFGEVCQGPGAFTITGPTGVQTQSAVTIAWSASEEATSYELTYSRESDLSFGLTTTLTATSFDTYLHNGIYYVGVKAINAEGETFATNNGFSITFELPPRDQLIFVTNTAYSISTTNQYPPNGSSIGSAQAADYQCTRLASQAGLLPEPWDGQKIYFRALVSQASFGVIARAGMMNNGHYNTAGNLVAPNVSTLMSGTFSAPILTQNKGQMTGTVGVWTGANSDGSATASNCFNWTQTTGTARAGNLNGIGTNWLNQQAVNCTTALRLYCVGDFPTTTVQFDELTPGTDVPQNYGAVQANTGNFAHAEFGANWHVSNDTLGGQLGVTNGGNYVNFSEPVSTLLWHEYLDLRIPALQAGPAGLAGLIVSVKDGNGTIVASQTIPPLNPGEARVASTVQLNGFAVDFNSHYEFARIENPNAPGAPAPLDSLRFFFAGIDPTPP